MAAAAPSSSTTSLSWPQQLAVYALIFTALLLLHAPLLRLPYFWDEAGYYIPAAHDLYVGGALIPHSTISNAHPPLVLAWLALAWRVFGFSPPVTRTAMLGMAAFSLLGLFRLARLAANPAVACATVLLVALYPVFFSQSSLAQLDLAAVGLTLWGLLAWVEDRPLGQIAWFTLAALTKETAILAPVALLVWDRGVRLLVVWETRQAASLRPRLAALAPPGERRSHGAILLLPLLPLACWYIFHYAKTGYLLGNPEFVRYNVTATIDAVRIPIALGIRLWQMFGYFGLWLLTLAGALAMTREPLISDPVTQRVPERSGLRVAQRFSAARCFFSSAALAAEVNRPRPRIPLWIQGAFFSVTLVYVLFMTLIGGAALARYMLPVVPLVMMVLISTLWRRVRYWGLIVVAIAIVFVTGLFHNPPYSFSLEDNLAYRDFVLLHREAIGVLERQFPQACVLTAWPASDELNRPWLGYVSKPVPVVRIEDFTSAEIARAVAERDQFDVALVFSTKYEPEHPIFENWSWWRHIKERYFGYHRDLKPEEIARRLDGRLLFRKEMKGQWVGIIGLSRPADLAISPDQQK